MTPPAGDPAFEDLRLLIRLGLARAGALLTAGERTVLDRISALDDAAGALYARLSARVPQAFPVDTLDDPEAVARLRNASLVHGAVSWSERAHLSTVEVLREACARLGLPRTGPKAALVARVAAHPGWDRRPWIRVCHRGLLRRVERWAFLRRHPDRRMMVVERLGHVTWPDYPVTAGPGLHRDRRALLRWEALIDGTPTVDEGLAALRDGSARAGGRLDLTGSLARALAEHARTREAADPGYAVGLYEALANAGHPADPVRHARALERAGDPRRALDLLRAALAKAPLDTRIAIHRAGRRLARARRTGWAPDRPLLRPRRRTLALAAGTPDPHRPRYRVGDEHLPVEPAVIARLAQLGRRALHAENGLWTTLFALLFADAYFLPVSGTLPSRWLSGPLDLGTPRFRPPREPVIASILDQVCAGDASSRIRAAWDRWNGVRLAGATWTLADGDTLADVADGLGPGPLVAVLEVLLDEGWHAARGLPDLVILPGAPVRIPEALPTVLGPGLVLAEIKGPGDTVRDAQAAWFHRLGAAGAPIALWEVRAAPPPPTGG